MSSIIHSLNHLSQKHLKSFLWVAFWFIIGLSSCLSTAEAQTNCPVTTTEVIVPVNDFTGFGYPAYKFYHKDGTNNNVFYKDETIYSYGIQKNANQNSVCITPNVAAFRTPIMPASFTQICTAANSPVFWISGGDECSAPTIRTCQKVGPQQYLYSQVQHFQATATGDFTVAFNNSDGTTVSLTILERYAVYTDCGNLAGNYVEKGTLNGKKKFVDSDNNELYYDAPNAQWVVSGSMGIAYKAASTADAPPTCDWTVVNSGCVGGNIKVAYGEYIQPANTFAASVLVNTGCLSHFNGTYYLSGIVDERPVYKRSDGEELKFDKSSLRWKIGGGVNGQLSNVTTTKTVPTSCWQASTGGSCDLSTINFTLSTNLQVANPIVMCVKSGCGTTAGTYTQTGISNERPDLKDDDQNRLYYWGAGDPNHPEGWYIRNSMNVSLFYNSSTNTAPPTTGWVPFTTDGANCHSSITVSSGECPPCPTPTTTISYAGSPFCSTVTEGTVTLTGASGGSYSSTTGLTIDAQTGKIDPSKSTAGSYTVTYTVDNDGCLEVITTNVVIAPIVMPTASISVSPTGTVLPGTSLTFTATIGNQGGEPHYQWKKNGTNIPQAWSSTYTSANFENGDKITFEVTNNDFCGATKTSNEIVVSIEDPCAKTPTNIVISGLSCGDYNGTYVPAGKENGAPKWILQDRNLIRWTGSLWELYDSEGWPVATNSTGSVSNLPCTGWVTDANVGCSGTPILSGGCGPLRNLATPSVNIGANPSGSITAGTSVTFTATPANGGTTPSYQWKKNGNDVGTNSATYTDAALVNGDKITCVMTSGETCTASATATSNEIEMSVTIANPIKICVSDACGVLNGTYVQTGMTNGKPKLVLDLGGGDAMVLEYSKGIPATGTLQWNINRTTNNLEAHPYIYSNPSTSNTPPLTGWVSNNKFCAVPNFTAGECAPPCVPPTSYNVTGGGPYCSGSGGSVVGLASSQAGVNYQLKKGGSNIGSVVAGTGSAISFGNQTEAGTYTVEATNTTGNCVATMSGNVVVSVVAQPVAYNVTGGGSFCQGGSGVVVGLSGSETGVSYQLKKGGVNVGSVVAGTGSAISFGVQSGGTYTVEATKTGGAAPARIGVGAAAQPSTVTCTQAMTGSAEVKVQTKPTIVLNTLQQTLNEGNTQVFCDTDANPVNGLQFTVSGLCVVGNPVWRVQVGGGSWSDWSATAPVSQSSNNQPHRYQAACDASCPVTYTSPIELTINYRASVPQNVSMLVDGVTVAAGETKEVCSLTNSPMAFTANCGAGELLLYSVDGGEYSAGVPLGLVDSQFHNYRVRCRKSDGTSSCVESESGVMRLKLVGIPAAPTVSLSPTTSCNPASIFSGQSSCGSLRTVWYNATTNVALSSLPSTVPSETSSYYARCQTENGCVSEKSNVVTFTVTPVNVAPIVTVSQDVVCTGTTVTVSANCPVGSTTSWNTGVSTPSFEVAFSNVTKQSYWAKCVFEGGCQSAESNRKEVYWQAFVVSLINIGESKSGIKSNDRAAWSSQFITADGGPELDQSTQQSPTLYYVENVNKMAPRYWTIHADACALGTNGSLTFDMLATPEMGVIRSFNTHENNAPYFMYANREGWTELYAQNHPAYGFYEDNGSGGNVYDAGLPKGLYKLSIRYWDMKGWGSIYPSTRKPQGNVLAYQEYWFRIQSKDGVGVGAAREMANGQEAKGKVQGSDNGKQLTDNGVFATVLPNPVTNILRLKVQDSKGQMVQTSLTDAVGREVLSRHFRPETNTHQEEFGVSELPTGIYFLRVKSEAFQSTLKVVKL
ncbi:T9SS type A sorting domain-containing protein [Runella sp. SP2]|uniref:T9SS type A sorting domain-containing protein n=1 Tax=Runella sp. SP2 TaxID=2268026 RepID=UPI0013DE3C7B|nr:T9SS type A sorting domain-containing protein [Runella sp. SP2]